MPKVILDDVEYEYEDLSAEAKANFDSIKHVQHQIQLKKQELTVLGAAKSMYSLALKKIIEGDENSEDQKTNWIESLGETVQFD